jgi:hypothetical protein
MAPAKVLKLDNNLFADELVARLLPAIQLLWRRCRRDEFEPGGDGELCLALRATGWPLLLLLLRRRRQPSRRALQRVLEGVDGEAGASEKQKSSSRVRVPPHPHACAEG